MSTTLELFQIPASLPSPSQPVVGQNAFNRGRTPKDAWRIVALRDCPLPNELQVCDTPQAAASYWRTHVTQKPYFNPDCQCFVVLLLNTRRRIKGHQLVTIGTLDTLLVHPREIFRLAVMTASAALILMHNLCAETHKKKNWLLVGADQAGERSASVYTIVESCHRLASLFFVTAHANG